ncbi:IS3 family transposase [Clostridium tyrobutyricum]|uniref:IS3 family transposase n=1 Tax=Clostridium tyrobutyricum TaxID=1519 RepID=UPI0030CEF25A
MSEKKETKKRHNYTTEFKNQIVELYHNGKMKSEIAREYSLSLSMVSRWIRQSENTGSFKEKDNRSREEQELIELRRKNKQLMMENDILKPSSADFGTKVNVIRNISLKYSVSAMCKVLQISRNTYYYKSKKKSTETTLISIIIDIFKSSRNNYGTRKIKVELQKKGYRVSRRKIGRIMKQNTLVSSYTKLKFKPHVDKFNESKIDNLVKREFKNQPYRNVVVSDLTYVRVRERWEYICILVDLFNREIIGYSAGDHKDAALVRKAFAKVNGNLRNIEIFHTDRGNEFKNKIIDEAMLAFQIKRSLSMKGCPYDNAVAEATFKIIKTEFVRGKVFESLDELKWQLADYVNWFNNHRIHSSLGYVTPYQFKLNNLKKVV